MRAKFFLMENFFICHVLYRKEVNKNTVSLLVRRPLSGMSMRIGSIAKKERPGMASVAKWMAPA
jgi:hypothetical protein